MLALFLYLNFKKENVSIYKNKEDFKMETLTICVLSIVGGYMIRVAQEVMKR